MHRKTWKDFHRDLSWSTRIYTLLTLLIIVLSYFFKAWDTNWAMTMIVALAAILFVESFAIVFLHHPKLWLFIRWMLILVLLGLILMGLLQE
ncbi:MAG: hypothetical protein OEQ53_05200 [Saprospiraceae bacterium]|nr:hypothetical protein [Saprospiraceae bacterium]